MIDRPHADKIREAEHWLQERFGDCVDINLRRVNEKSLDREWLIEIKTGSKLSLKVIIPLSFPSDMIRVYWLHGTREQYPHCFPSGQLCFYEHALSFSDVDHDMNLVMHSVGELINECSSGSNQADFYTEPRPYWSFHQEEAGKRWFLKAPQVVNITPAAVESCTLIYGIRAKRKWYVAENVKHAHALAQACAGEIDELTHSIGVRIPLTRAWHPKQFPTSWKNVYRLMHESGRCQEAIELLEQERSRDCWLASVFIYFDAPEVSYGFQLPIVQGYPGIRGRELVKRPLKKESFESFFQSAKAGPVAICNTHDLAGENLFSRLAMPDMTRRNNAKVLLVGCGSLGGMVAEELILAGVRNLTLVDHDKFSAENLCRHVLSMDSLGRYKADALKEHLSKKMPLLNVSAYSGTIEGYLYHLKKSADHFDLILAMTGESGPIWALDVWRRQGTQQSTPMLVGWAEAFGLAGHAALLMKGQYMEDIEENAERKHNMIQWPDGSANYLLKEPGCSATYQPMGRSKLLHVTALNVETALQVLDGYLESSQVSSYVEPLSKVYKHGAISKSDSLHQSVESFQAGIIRRDV